MTTSFYKTLNFMVWCGGEGGAVGFEEVSIDPIILFQDYYCDLYIVLFVKSKPYN